MNLRFVLGLAVMVAASANAQTQAPSSAPAAVEKYHYGMPLDIAKVEQMSEPATTGCGVIKARMTYLDHAGLEHTLQYRKLSEACDAN